MNYKLMNNRFFSKIWVIVLLIALIAGGILSYQYWLKPSKLERHENVHDSIKQSRNYIDLAEETKDESYCEKINVPGMPTIRAECYTKLASLKNNPSICENIRISSLKSSCVRQFSEKEAIREEAKKEQIKKEIVEEAKKYPGAGGGPGAYNGEPVPPGNWEVIEKRLPKIVRPGKDIEGWETFVENEKAGYSIDYPAKWIIARGKFPNCGKNCKYVEDLLVQNLPYVSFPGNGPENGSVFEITILEYSSPLGSIRDWIMNSDLSESQKEKRISRIRTMTIAGVDRKVSRGERDTDWQGGITFIEGNRLYKFTYFSGSSEQFDKDLSIFKRILSSFVFEPIVSQQCLDGTSYGQCTSAKPRYCQKCIPKRKDCETGELINKCSICGCPSGEKCQSNGTCKKINPLIAIIVNSSILSGIQPALDQYKADLKEEGYAVEIHSMEGRKPDILRNYLRTQLSNNLVGALLVGNLPVAYFEEKGMHDKMYTFPIDLFYMDLDGSWLDIDKNGIYDHHKNGNGDILPEIWVGRLTPNGFGSSVDLLNNYFRKDHLYRSGKLTLPRRALAYNTIYIRGKASLDSIYGNNVDVVHYKQTSADNYKSMLTKGYQWIDIEAHSCPTAVYFPTGDFVDSKNIYNIDPKVFFYALNNCSACRYTEDNYLGGAYIFAPTYGLGAIGHTAISLSTINSILYSFLSESENLGEGYEQYIAYLLLNYPDAEKIYGILHLTLLGDPTLSLSP